LDAIGFVKNNNKQFITYHLNFNKQSNAVPHSKDEIDITEKMIETVPT